MFGQALSRAFPTFGKVRAVFSIARELQNIHIAPEPCFEEPVFKSPNLITLLHACMMVLCSWLRVHVSWSWSWLRSPNIHNFLELLKMNGNLLDPLRTFRQLGFVYEYNISSGDQEHCKDAARLNL